MITPGLIGDLYRPIFFSLPYISLYFTQFALYTLYFPQFHQNNGLNPKATTKINGSHGLTGPENTGHCCDSQEFFVPGF